MNSTCATDILALGAVTGMRSMSGPAALALTQHGLLRKVVPLLALGEMIADKTSFVGDRTDALPLAGRALMGAIVGGAVAREYRTTIAGGALLGGVVAVAAAHLAYRLRARFSAHSSLAGAVEDAIVAMVAGTYAARASHRI